MKLDTGAACETDDEILARVLPEATERDGCLTFPRWLTPREFAAVERYLQRDSLRGAADFGVLA